MSQDNSTEKEKIVDEQHQDIEKILFTSEDIAKRVKELGETITKDMKGFVFECSRCVFAQVALCLIRSLQYFPIAYDLM